MKSIGLAFLAGSYFTGAMLASFTLIDWNQAYNAHQVHTLVAMGLFFGISISLASYFSEKRLKDKYPHSAISPEHVTISRRMWEEFLDTRTLIFEGKQLVFKPKDRAFIAQLPWNFNRTGLSLILEPLMETQSSVLLSLKVKSWSPIMLTHYGQEVNAHHEVSLALAG